MSGSGPPASGIVMYSTGSSVSAHKRDRPRVVSESGRWPRVKWDNSDPGNGSDQSFVEHDSGGFHGLTLL
jgi:hypothetical protein